MMTMTCLIGELVSLSRDFPGACASRKELPIANWKTAAEMTPARALLSPRDATCLMFMMPPGSKLFFDREKNRSCSVKGPCLMYQQTVNIGVLSERS